MCTARGHTYQWPQRRSWGGEGLSKGGICDRVNMRACAESESLLRGCTHLQALRSGSVGGKIRVRVV